MDRPAAAVRRARAARQPRPAAQPPAQAAKPIPRAPRPVTRADEVLSVVSTTAVMCLLIAGWVLLQMLHLGGVAQERAQAAAYGEFRAQLAAGTAPLGPVTDVGDPVALITIPHIGLEQVVTEGTASGDLLGGPGHLRNTVLPGQAGTSAIFGRGATYGGPFARLAELYTGDEITVVTAQGSKKFTVIGIRTAGDELPQPRPDGASRLVLVTAAGEGRYPSLTPDQVVYVDAEAKQAYDTPPGLPAAVPDSEQVMGTESGAVLPLLALCLGLLVAAAIAVVAARQRFGAALVWVIATPVVLALAWVTTDVAMRLLPNLM